MAGAQNIIYSLLTTVGNIKLRTFVPSSEMLGEVSIHLDFIALNLFWKVDVFTLSLPKGTECGFSPNETILFLWVCLVLNQSSSDSIQQIVCSNLSPD